VVEFYAHFEVVLGMVVLFGWKLAKLAVIPYILNCLAFYQERNKAMLGIQVMLVGVILGFNATDNPLE
jgi:hypothetical protein